jgi:CheY-like chemotaxis protein
MGQGKMEQIIPIGSLLVEAGVISVETLERVLYVQNGSGKRLGTLLNEMGIVTEEEVVEALARQCSLKTIRHFAEQDFPRELLELVSADLALDKLIFPLKRNQGMLAIAVLDPFDHDTFKQLEKTTGLRIYLAIASRDDILAAIRTHYLQGNGRKICRQTLLLMESSPINLKILQAALEKEGYEVLMASDGIEGLKSAFSNHPDLIICDACMPSMDGYTFMHALKAHPETTDIPVILTSPKDSPEDEHRALKAGFTDYIGKPVMPVRLLARVGKTFASLEKRRRSAPRSAPLPTEGQSLTSAVNSALPG